MNTKIVAAFALAAVAATSAFADGDTHYPVQSTVTSQPAGLTRAQVRAQLVALEKVGYAAVDANTNYPENVQAAEARIAQNPPAATTVAAQEGPMKKISFLSVLRSHQTVADNTKSIYFGG
jgi:Domain of unknown function (DUF4148)